MVHAVCLSLQVPLLANTITAGWRLSSDYPRSLNPVRTETSASSGIQALNLTTGTGSAQPGRGRTAHHPKRSHRRMLDSRREGGAHGARLSGSGLAARAAGAGDRRGGVEWD